MGLLRDLDFISYVIDVSTPPAVASDYLALVLIAEDRRFWRHLGVDLRACIRAFGLYASGRPKGGASTIEMQLVRTITDRRERTVRRKLREAILAILIARRFSKRRIVDCYLDIAYFGKDIIGAEAAALSLFRKEIAKCSPAHQAALAALLVYPIPVNRTMQWYSAVFRRARYIRLQSNMDVSTKHVHPPNNPSPAVGPPFPVQPQASRAPSPA